MYLKEPERLRNSYKYKKYEIRTRAPPICMVRTGPSTSWGLWKIRARNYCLERELHGIFLKIIGAKVSSRLVSITFIINSK